MTALPPRLQGVLEAQPGPTMRMMSGPEQTPTVEGAPGGWWGFPPQAMRMWCTTGLVGRPCPSRRDSICLSKGG